MGRSHIGPGVVAHGPDLVSRTTAGTVIYPLTSTATHSLKTSLQQPEKPLQKHLGKVALSGRRETTMASECSMSLFPTDSPLAYSRRFPQEDACDVFLLGSMNLGMLDIHIQIFSFMTGCWSTCQYMCGHQKGVIPRSGPGAQLGSFGAGHVCSTVYTLAGSCGTA